MSQRKRGEIIFSRRARESLARAAESSLLSTLGGPSIVGKRTPGEITKLLDRSRMIKRRDKTGIARLPDVSALRAGTVAPSLSR
jgi:hypothetical protein